MTSKTALRFALHPIDTKVRFKRLFVAAKAKWPNVADLHYVGSDVDGNHYMQQWGNPAPFIVTEKDLGE